ncbi:MULTISPECIES: globin domain-containing protein [Crocosphaera]|uniref:Flavohemoprotein (Hemoglobin-like protein) (Flavohemoglobin) (Nitric oxide dioxygenase) n=4 Tax=Crocosphaera watsonii TaxID=263511 RepID=T2JNS3_CROWT|nr:MULTISPECIES: globin domain-containing protein [Crocosphaera]EHJ14182.1 Putative bacterial hemoglobin [Crocosphaera watsonii WH 0003]NQZ61695.1 bacitracin resistance protein BacA [Crocosphaera sp.]CCQ66696.1 Flavohemoprotein (Hemoglobin-like protein) (Flavohemoglobin) (Nitric oxide dioxygenase) [Crocosphaera watsonii WH 0402]
MTPETIKIVKSTAPVVKEKGKEITERMYEIAFNERPEYRRFFENTHMKSPEEGRKQAAKLAASVYAYASHIDELEKLGNAVEQIAHAHVNTRVIAEQYPVIGECLLAAMKDILGDAATPEVMEAWTEAYNSLADIFITREKEIYRQQDKKMQAKLK